MERNTSEPESTQQVLIPWTARDHAETCCTALLVLRDVANGMHEEALKDEPVDCSYIEGWITRIDFLTNVLVQSNDGLLAALRSAGHATMLQTSTQITRQWRSTPSGAEPI